MSLMFLNCSFVALFLLSCRMLASLSIERALSILIHNCTSMILLGLNHFPYERHVYSQHLNVNRWTTLMRATDPPPGQGPEADKSRAKGLYMWGGVGVGKTMLMDIFVSTAPKEFKVRRIHFHDLMIDVHSRLREFSGEQVRPCLHQPRPVISAAYNIFLCMHMSCSNRCCKLSH